MLIETTYNGHILSGSVVVGDSEGDGSIFGGAHTISPYVENAFIDGVETDAYEHIDALIEAAMVEHDGSSY